MSKKKFESFQYLLNYYQFLQGKNYCLGYESFGDKLPEKKEKKAAKIEEVIVKKDSSLSKINTLEEFYNFVKLDLSFPLKKDAKNTVIMDGSMSSNIMVIGEAPGEEEDESGIPFCGKSGNLLTSIFASIGLKRSDLYITNVCFWRPPDNRKPTKQEIAFFKPILQKHISLLNPKIIIIVGSTSFECVFEEIKDPFSNYIGKIKNYTDGEKTIPTFSIYHPSFLARSYMQKRKTWEYMLDLKASNLMR